jgi:lysyl-tRNA synthetase, class II
MTTSIPLIELRQRRLDKAATLRGLGIEPYPSRAHRTHLASTVISDFERLEGSTVTVAGRLMSWRTHGALTFGHVQDQSGRVQLFIRRTEIGETEPAQGHLGYEHLRLMDVGDFVEASGPVTKTERGEISVLVKTIRLLTKALRPLPEKWHGITDRETIIRRRYLHTIMDPEHRVPFAMISDMIAGIRTFLTQRGFQEFQTPILQPQYGGGTARPFLTHVNALNCDMYLAISHELYLKRLIVAGFEKVFTIGRYFRNEGIDRSHNPEFSMLETMTAYENYEYNMQLVEDLHRHVATEVFRRTTFSVLGHQVSFDRPWRRVAMVEAVDEQTGLDFSTFRTLVEANEALATLGVRDPQPSIGHALLRAFEAAVEPTLIQPTIVYGHPVEISPLAKPSSADPRYAERFEFFIAGVERGDNWTEQNDPIHLLNTWRTIRELNRGDEEESHPLDYDFLEAMEHGMPPTTGIGPGIERMAMIFTEQSNIDEVLFFPMTRPALSPVNAAVYGVGREPSVLGLPAMATLSLDDWQSLIEESVIRPVKEQITVYPYLVIWPGPTATGRWRATGYVEVDGLVSSGRWRIPVYSTASATPIDVARETGVLLENIERRLVTSLRTHFQDASVRVGEITLDGSVSASTSTT